MTGLGLRAALPSPKTPVSTVKGDGSPCQSRPAFGSAPWSSRSVAAVSTASTSIRGSWRA
ncbi:hypothetical protein ACFQV8_17750 [Pseudonocardia benzenivorans]